MVTPETPGPSLPGREIPNADEFARRRELATERILRDTERSSSIPMEGQDIFDGLKRAEIGDNGDATELKKAIYRSRAYQEGLLDATSSVLTSFDPEKPHNLDTRRALSYFKYKYLTVEGTSDRPNAPYLLIQEHSSVEGPLRRGEQWRADEEGYRERRRKDFEDINDARIYDGKTPLPENFINAVIDKDVARLANERLAAGELLSLRNFIEARETIDFAFRQRMSTCEDPGAAAKLGNEIRAVSPDGPTWESFFNTEYGEQVDQAFEEIAKFGIPESVVQRMGLTPIPTEVRKRVCGVGVSEHGVYADGFNNSTAFAHWIKYLHGKFGNRMDVVNSGWKLSLVWETIEDLGLYENADGLYVMAAPPLGNSLISQTSHTKEKRRYEFGLDKDGNRVSVEIGDLKEPQVEKFLSHSGLPLSIDAIPKLCSGFLKQTSIEFGQAYFDMTGLEDKEFVTKMAEVLLKIKEHLPKNPNDPDYDKAYDKLSSKIEKFLKRSIKKDKLGNPKLDKEGKPQYEVKSVKVSLWDLRFYGGWKFSDKYFPWLISDQPQEKDSEAGELPSGAFGFWLLTRSRAASILSTKEGKGIKDIPRLEDMADPEFFRGILRNWTKVLKTINGVKPADNPRAHQLLTWLHYYKPGPLDGDTPATRRVPCAKKYRSLSTRYVPREIPMPGSRDVALGVVLSAATEATWIRPSDADWIQEELGDKVVNFTEKSVLK